MREGNSRYAIVPELVIARVVALIAIMVTGCPKGLSPSGEAQASPFSSIASLYNHTNGMVQSSNGGAVRIDIGWRGQKNDSLVFYVATNTHSADLDQYNLRELAVPSDNAGNEYQATSWEAPPGGHHVRGMLGFTLPASRQQGEAEYVEIIIRGVDGVEERIMRWEL